MLIKIKGCSECPFFKYSDRWGDTTVYCEQMDPKCTISTWKTEDDGETKKGIIFFNGCPLKFHDITFTT
jgi:hypothetical protein